MTGDSQATGTVLQQRNAPQALRALDLHPELIDRLVEFAPDYVDLFTTTASDATAATPEQWARAAIEGARAGGRFMAWRAMLRLRLEPHPWTPPAAARSDADHIAGWQIVENGDRWIRVEASSRVMTAQMVFQVEAQRVSFATCVRYDRPGGAVIWKPVSAIHRRIAPRFLGAAVRRINRARAT